MKSVFLVMLSAISLSGEIVQAGDVAEVTEAEAINFLNRGKARLATADDDADIPDTNGAGIGRTGNDDTDNDEVDNNE